MMRGINISYLFLSLSSLSDASSLIFDRLGGDDVSPERYTVPPSPVPLWVSGEGVRTAGGAAENNTKTLAGYKNKKQNFLSNQNKKLIKICPPRLDGGFFCLKHFCELVEEVHRVGRSRSGFRVKLTGEEGESFVLNSFNRVVVQVFQPNFPSGF